MYLLELSARDGTGKGRGISGEGTGFRGDGGAWGHPLPIVDGTSQCCLPWAAYCIGGLCASHHSSCIPLSRFRQHAYFYQYTKIRVQAPKTVQRGTLCFPSSMLRLLHWHTKSHSYLQLQGKTLVESQHFCQDATQSSWTSAYDQFAHAGSTQNVGNEKPKLASDKTKRSSCAAAAPTSCSIKPKMDNKRPST